MTRNDFSFTIALVLALSVHAFLVRAGADWYASMRIYLPPLEDTTTPKLLPIESAVVVVPSQPPLGTKAGIGDSPTQSPGELQQFAREGLQEQAYLSRDDIGLSSLTAGGSLLGGQTSSPSTVGVQPASPARLPEVESRSRAPREPTETPHNPQASAAPTPVATAQQSSAAQPAASATPRGAEEFAQNNADPAPLADSEVDPFSRIGTAEFRRGRVDVRLGRQYRITRPRVDLAAMIDNFASARVPVVVLEMTLDEAGYVRDVNILRGSGYLNIDQAARLAAFQWWFEPLRNRSGTIVHDRIVMTLSWR